MNNIEVKTILNVPWGHDEGNWKPNARVSNEADAYALVPLIHRAVNIRCNSLTRVPVYAYEGDNILKNGYEFEAETPLRDLLWRVEAGMLLTGFSPVLKQSNEYGFKKGLQWINPFTIKYDYRNKELIFWQEVKETGERFPKGKGFWTVEDFLYFREFNPLDDLGPGTAPTSVALGDARILANVSTFLGGFFGADAVPITMVVMPPGTGVEEQQKVELWFKKRVRGLRNAVSRVLGVSGEIKLEKLTADLDTYDFPDVDNHALQGISDAFGVPQSLLRADSGANRAISDNERESYLNDTIVPRCKYFESIINPFLEEYGQRIEFAPEELPEMQEDEQSRASSLKALIDSGIPLMAALDILGYDLSEEAEDLIEESEKKKEEQANTPVIVAQPDPNNPDQSQIPPEDEEPIKAEIDKWMRKAKKSYQTRKVALVEFDSEVIPDEMREKVNVVLAGKSFMDGLKRGNRHSEGDRQKLQAIHDLSGEMGARHQSMKANTMSSILQVIHDQSIALGANCG